ncbi:MAG: hypothetical protein KGD57_09335 [Candidatus Lokiarchaeota archaeon]|nr:hypothetical protein [Candidatus Lokiarchaeota archaeon]
MPREYTFGPVKSRRLGLSLGIDILPNKKFCTYDCVYCEIGCTSPNQLVSPEYKIKRAPSSNFRKELKDILKYFPHLQSITFGYNGEPTLNENILEYLEIALKIREEIDWNEKPLLTLLTNSSTLQMKEVRNKVTQFDFVITKLDAGNQKDFKNTNRPHKNVPHVDDIIKSIIKLKREMPKKNSMAIQSLIYQSYKKEFISNNNEENIIQLAYAIKNIKPDYVQLYSIARIPAESYIYSVDENQLKIISKKIKTIIDDNSIIIKHY